MTREKVTLAEENIDLESVLTDGRMTVPVQEDVHVFKREKKESSGVIH